MKTFLMPLLGLLAGAASAAPDVPEQPLTAKYLKEYAIFVAAGYCDATTQHHTSNMADSPQVENFDASNEDLHLCQYAHEMSATGCVQSGSCADYDTWTKANPAISPSQPREVFISALKTRKIKLASDDDTASRGG